MHHLLHISVLCIVHFQLTGMLEPVLVNDKLACKFAKAWTTPTDGSEEVVNDCSMHVLACCKCTYKDVNK